MSQPRRREVSPAAELQGLLAGLVACDSTNPSLVPGGAGESAVAELVVQQLQGAGLEVRTWEPTPGRKSVLARLPGMGGGRTLLLCSHLDVVGSEPTGFVPQVRDGRMHGRGTSDMKGGLAASMLAVTELARSGRLAGDVLVAGVIDEEWLSAGAVDLVRRLAEEEIQVDAAILPEATGLELVVEHGGFAWWELHSLGAEAAGDDPERGRDAIALLGGVLTGLVALDDELARGPAKPYGRPSVHASTIAGGIQLSAYPASCVVGIERCLIPGETAAQARAEVEAVIAAAQDRDHRADLRLREVVGREPISLSPGEAVVKAVAEVVRQRGAEPVIRGDMGWMDSGILVGAGIPCLAFGPIGGGEHTSEEWVDLASVIECAEVLAATARQFCAALP